MTQFVAQLGGRDGFSDDLLHHVDSDGVEYFTVKATGQSGMSLSGLAKFLGVQQAQISRWVKRVQQAEPLNNSLPKCLKSFARLKKAYPRLGTMDLKIAAIALVNQSILLTRNFGDFGKIAGLNIEDWT